MIKKALIMAAGAGARVGYRAKGLMTVYDKLAMHFAFDLAIDSGIHNIALVTNHRDYEKYYYTDKQIYRGHSYDIITQDATWRGVVGGIMSAEDWLKGEGALVVFVDTINLDERLPGLIKDNLNCDGNVMFMHYNGINPQDCGQVLFGSSYKVLDIREKADPVVSNYVAGGVNLFSGDQFMESCKSLVPSARGELEITDLNKVYLNCGKLKLGGILRGVYDIGTFDGLYLASTAVKDYRNGYFPNSIKS